MLRRFKAFCSTHILFSIILGSFVFLGSTPAGADSPCFGVRVDYLGRTPFQNINGVQYYLWKYRVTGQGCINRGYSHWILALCASTSVSSVSTQSVDNSDPPGGTTTNFMPVLGQDPSTGTTYGLKWNYVSGNQLDKVNEYDEFSFVASGPVVTLDWAAKGGTAITTGTVQGPGCLPVPTKNTTWSSIKTRFE